MFIVENLTILVKKATFAAFTTISRYAYLTETNTKVETIESIIIIIMHYIIFKYMNSSNGKNFKNYRYLYKLFAQKSPTTQTLERMVVQKNQTDIPKHVLSC